MSPLGLDRGHAPRYTIGWICRKARRPGGPHRPADESTPRRLRSLQNTNHTVLRFRARLPNGALEVEIV